jgi:phage terminase Nu1 subunit (DNA packaging protein)
MKRSQPPVELTAARFSNLVGCDRHELLRKLGEMNAKPAGTKNGGTLYKLRDLCRAYAGGDIEAERLRKTREEADKLAIQNARSRGELVEVASVKKLGQRVMAAVRNRILNMPMTDEEKDGCLRELLELGGMDWSREA